MSRFDVVARRLANQQIAAPRLASVSELVRWMGAVQAQDYRGGLWATGLRLAKGDASAIEDAIAARTVVRTWPMRGTLHFVPAEDARCSRSIQRASSAGTKCSVPRIGQVRTILPSVNARSTSATTLPGIRTPMDQVALARS